MRHPTEGVLRRLLDEPSGVAVSDRQHVHDCATCHATLDVVRRDADLVRAALPGASAADLDLERARRRLSAAPTPRSASRTPVHPRGKVSSFLRRPSVAALAFVVVLGGAGTAAANDWFTIFRTERVEAISISAADLVALPDLSAYGDLEITQQPHLREARDASTAEALSGLSVPTVGDLPRGVDGEPTYQVGDQVSATFTFSTDRAAEAAAKVGEALPPPPPGLDGSSVRMVAGPGVAQLWTSDAGAPALVVGRVVAPTASSTGLAFEDLRDYLLAVPGLPPDVAEQLRTFTADGSTLPLPVPADQVTATATEVGAAPATLLVTRNKAFAAVVWVDDGLVTLVAGSVDSEEVLSVARGLR